MLLTVENALCKYAKVTLHSVEREDTFNMYLAPGAVLKARCASYLNDGYHIESVAFLNKEEYYNERINETVEMLNDTQKEECKLRIQFKHGAISLASYIEALGLTNEVKLGYLQVLFRQMNRFAYDDVVCHNECAKAWYHLYF